MGKGDAYDMLLPPGPGWKPRTALVVSPYVEPRFFERFARKVRPGALHVVIDDGCRREDPARVREALRRGGFRGDAHVRLGWARGLVHLKLFYVRWQSDAGRSARTLVFGSANATHQGFDGDVNAELLAGSRLRASHERRVIAWCERMIAATVVTEAVDVEGEPDGWVGGVTVRLPAVKVVSDAREFADLDLWIQRGALLSEFRPDPAFLQVPVRLAKPLDADQQSVAAQRAGLEVKLSRSIRHRYIDDGSRTEEQDAGPPDGGRRATWRRKLFTRTSLGEWCSSACVAAHGSEFVRSDHDRRLSALEELKALADKGVRKSSRRVFMDKMEALWTELGDDAADFLHGGPDGIDRQRYRKAFDDKVRRDLRLAGDDEYAKRYVRGFDLVDVPRFRNDVAGWRAFVESLAEELVFEATRGRTRSRLVRAIENAIPTMREDDTLLLDRKRLLDFLHATFAGRGRRAMQASATITGYDALV